jgi:hypothetical protein
LHRWRICWKREDWRIQRLAHTIERFLYLRASKRTLEDVGSVACSGLRALFANWLHFLPPTGDPCGAHSEHDSQSPCLLLNPNLSTVFMN